MSEYKERVIHEKADLDSKLIKLKSFLKSANFELLDKNEQTMLTKQSCIMQEYTYILSERISAFMV